MFKNRLDKIALFRIMLLFFGAYKVSCCIDAANEVLYVGTVDGGAYSSSGQHFGRIWHQYCAKALGFFHLAIES